MASRFPAARDTGLLELEEHDSGFWRQLSEPVKIQTGAADSANARRASDPADSPWTRRASEPVKVEMSSLLESQAEQAKQPASLRSEEDESSTVLVTPDSVRSSSPRSSGTPVSRKLSDGQHAVEEVVADAHLPRWVKPPGGGARATLAPGAGRSCTYMVNLTGVSEHYTEALLVEELRDAGFAKGRDLDLQFMPADPFAGHLTGRSVVSFLSVPVMRAFVAAFHGRPSRYFPTTFAVSSCGEHESVAARLRAMEQMASVHTQHFMQRQDMCFCPSCGGQAHSSFNFCTSCGQPLWT